VTKAWRSAIAAAVAVGLATGCSAAPADVTVSGAVPSPSTTTAPAPPSPVTVPATAAPGVGADGVGDALYPTLGNGGYDVGHYDLQLSTDPATGALSGVATIDATAVADLRTFDLDFAGMTVDDISVNGTAATWTANDAELVITPSPPLSAGAAFRTAIRYHGVPSAEAIPSFGLPTGWIRTPGGSYTINEPDAGHTWFPSNDHPSDKATFTFHISVPNGTVAVANGVASPPVQNGDRTTWTWTMAQPMATYLTAVAIGDYAFRDATGPNGLPVRDAYLRRDAAAVTPCLDLGPQIIGFFESRFGPYPFDTAGLLVADSTPGLAMETQSRPLFSDADFAHGCPDDLLSHELAHQWFGDAVSPARWQDVWLNEGFATYGQWLWSTKDDPTMMDRLAQQALAEVHRAGTPLPPVARPTVDTLFSDQVYDGGAAVLQQLRREVGDATFFAILRQWVVRYSGKSASTEDFMATASDVAGRDLVPFLAGLLER
jgi:aminopeptidase N